MSRLLNIKGVPLVCNAFLRHFPRVVFMGAAFTARDFQHRFDIPTIAIIAAAIPGIVVLTAVTDRTTAWIKELLGMGEKEAGE